MNHEGNLISRQLQNGLTVLVEPLPDRGFAVVNSWFDVGSAADPPGRSGLAHLTEHVVLGIGDDRDTNGRSTAGSSNATTSFERTNFVDVADPDAVPRVIEAWGRRLRAAATCPVSELEIRAASAVVVEEIEEREQKNRYGSGLRRSLRLLFGPGHPFGRPPVGSPIEVDACTPEDVTDLVTKGYAPERSVLTVVGTVDPAEVMRHAATHLGGLGGAAAVSVGATARATITGATPDYPMPSPGVRREDVEDGQATGLVRYTFALPPERNRLSSAAELMMLLIGGAPWAMLERAPDTGVISTSSEYIAARRGPSIGMIKASVAPGASTESVEEWICRVLADVTAGRVDTDVFEVALARVRVNQLARLSALRERAEDLCRIHAWNGTGGGFAHLAPTVARPCAGGRSTVCLDDVIEVATEWLSRAAIVVFHPYTPQEWIV
jgi:zinc protease